MRWRWNGADSSLLLVGAAAAALVMASALPTAPVEIAGVGSAEASPAPAAVTAGAEVPRTPGTAADSPSPPDPAQATEHVTSDEPATERPTERRQRPRRTVRPALRIVSTSGIPHADVGDLRRSRHWRRGMPRGTNANWSRYLRRQVRAVTDGADVVLFQGDQVEGRWGVDIDGTGVFGPTRTPAERRAAVREAGNTYYPWLNAFWRGTRVIWAAGDHEIGDLPSTGRMPAGSAAHVAHDAFVDVWRRHHGGRTQYATRIGDVGVVTLFPFEKDASGVVARLSRSDIRWMRRRIAALRRQGARWVFVQSEIPLIGPNRGRRTSGLLVGNGTAAWRALRRLDVDLILAAEFHVETTHSDRGTTPLHIVHGRATRGDAAYLVIDVHRGRNARLELRMRQLPGRRAGSSRLWATDRRRAPTRPVTGVRPRQLGRATVWPDGTVTGRTGVLRDYQAP